MSDLDDDMSGPGDMGVLDQEKINEFRTLVRDTREAGSKPPSGQRQRSTRITTRRARPRNG